MSNIESGTIDTAVVMCGGKGTRDLPFSLLRPNTLGEIGRRNAFDIVTQQLAAVGVENLVVVVPDKLTDGVNFAALQINRWFNGDPRYQEELMADGKSKELIAAAGPHSYGIQKLYFAPQSQENYGTAASVAAASGVLQEIQEKTDSTKFLVVNGDGFMHRTDGGSDIADLIQAVEEVGAAHGLLTTPIEKIYEGKYKYGVIERDENGNFIRINEGPQAAEVITDHPEGNVGLYLFDRTFLTVNDEYMSQPLPDNRKEYWITDPIELAAQNEAIVATAAKGTFIDCATPELRDQAKAVLSMGYWRQHLPELK
jgi:NDP-sugar pyrophosphorylase family protein